MNAQSIYDTQFSHCPRSPEWKAGALRGLQKALREPCPTGSPYAAGTVQDDAWRSGFQNARTGCYERDGFDAHGFRLDAKVIGDGYVPRPAAVPGHEDSAAHSAAAQTQPPHVQTLSPATNQTDGGHQ